MDGTTCLILMSRPVFLYANGTANMLQLWDIGFNLTLPGFQPVDPDPPYVEVHGLDGKVAGWDGSPSSDPFPSLLNKDLWDARKIGYPAAMFPMSTSIGAGVTKMINELLTTPPGTKFALGGYSQGAAVASRAYKILVQDNAYSRASDFIGGVTFGNPDREINRTQPLSSWSGAWDNPGSTQGGHGAFPEANRMVNTPYSWWDFVHEGEIITATGDTDFGTIWSNSAGFIANNDLTGLANILSLVDDVVASFFGIVTPEAAAIKAALEIASVSTVWSGANGTSISISGGGHVAYPFVPPTGFTPITGMPSTWTSYQIALYYLESIARDALTAPIVLPTLPASQSQAGWATYLVAP